MDQSVNAAMKTIIWQFMATVFLPPYLVRNLRRYAERKWAQLAQKAINYNGVAPFWAASFYQRALTASVAISIVPFINHPLEQLAYYTVDKVYDPISPYVVRMTNHFRRFVRSQLDQHKRSTQPTPSPLHSDHSQESILHDEKNDNTIETSEIVAEISTLSQPSTLTLPSNPSMTHEIQPTEYETEFITQNERQRESEEESPHE